MIAVIPASMVVELDKELVLRHYSHGHVQDAILSISQDKEVVGSFGGQGYAQRPSILQYPDDIIQLVKKGVTSFHISEETWMNPMMLLPGMSPKDLASIRTGWDLIIDIDISCEDFEYSKFAADLVIQHLHHVGINALSVKFSGNHGFHIAVPFEAFPTIVNGRPIAELFPEAPQLIAEYIKNTIVDLLSDAILRYEKRQHGLPEDAPDSEIIPYIQEKADLPFEKLTKQERHTEFGQTVETNRFYAFHLIEIDTCLISSRHLVRHVYSINEKSGWVSLPINPSKIMQFDRDIARIENFVESKYRFLDRNVAIPGEARQLFHLAYDARTRQTYFEEEKPKQREYDDLSEAVPETYFPPPIKQILEGISDGRKRAVFVLKNYLLSLHWSPREVVQFILDWNQRNKEPLRESLVQSQLRNLDPKNAILPPNYDNKAYYESMGIDVQDALAKGVKNPVTHTLRRYYAGRGKIKKETAAKPQE